MTQKPHGSQVGSFVGAVVRHTMAQASERVRKGVDQAHAARRQLHALLTPRDKRLCETCRHFDPEGAAAVFARHPAFYGAMQHLDPAAMVGEDAKGNGERWDQAGVCLEHGEVRFAPDSCTSWELR